jgi:hypothetical protein
MTLTKFENSKNSKDPTPTSTFSVIKKTGICTQPTMSTSLIY